MSPAPSVEQSATVSRCGRSRGRGHDHDFGGGCGSFGGGCGFCDGRHTIGDKGPIKCKHCGRNNYVSEKC